MLSMEGALRHPNELSCHSISLKDFLKSFHIHGVPGASPGSSVASCLGPQLKVNLQPSWLLHQLAPHTPHPATWLLSPHTDEFSEKQQTRNYDNGYFLMCRNPALTG